MTRLIVPFWLAMGLLALVELLLGYSPVTHPPMFSPAWSNGEAAP